MPQIQNHPEPHTDFIFSVTGGDVWAVILIVAVCVGALGVFFFTRRSRRR